LHFSSFALLRLWPNWQSREDFLVVPRNISPLGLVGCAKIAFAEFRSHQSLQMFAGVGLRNVQIKGLKLKFVICVEWEKRIGKSNKTKPSGAD